MFTIRAGNAPGSKVVTGGPPLPDGTDIELARKIREKHASIQEQFDPPESEYPNALFHYTTADGLHGILTSDSLLATHYSALNDSAELRYGHEKLLAVIEHRLKRARNTQHREFYSALVDHIRDACREHGGYVASFCARADILSQYRIYGGAGGYALGFDTQRLLFSQGPAYLRLYRVEYDPAKQDALLEEWMAFCDSMIDECHATLGQDGIFATLGYLMTELYSTAFAFLVGTKHWDFREEMEWRLAIGQLDVPASPLSACRGARARAGLIVPHLRYSFATSKPAHPLQSIVIGPSRDPEVARLGVEHLLLECRRANPGVPSASVTVLGSTLKV